MSDMYKKIKKQNGEAFAQTLRNYHNGLLEIAGIDQIVRHAGREAAPLLPYLMSLLSASNSRLSLSVAESGAGIGALLTLSTMCNPYTTFHGGERRSVRKPHFLHYGREWVNKG